MNTILPNNVTYHAVQGLGKPYTVSHEHIASMRPMWVARYAGALVTYCEDRAVAEEMCRIHAYVRGNGQVTKNNLENA